jgi:hypothetical protein
LSRGGKRQYATGLVKDGLTPDGTARESHAHLLDRCVKA